MRALRLQCLDHLEEVDQRAGQPVKADHHQRVAGSDRGQQPRDDREREVGARGLFLMDDRAARLAQFTNAGQGSARLWRREHSR